MIDGENQTLFTATDGMPPSDDKISEEDLTVVVDGEGDQPPPKTEKTFHEKLNNERTKNKNPFKERISRLTNDVHTQKQTNQMLQAELAEKNRLLQLKEQELRNRELNTQRLYESNLENEERSILQNLKLAKEDGDIDAEIKFQQDLARVKGEQTTYNVLKQQQQYTPSDVEDSDTTFYPTNTNPYNYDESQYADDPQDQYEEDLPEAYQEFLDRNPWANPNSQQYSPELADEATVFAAELNKRLKFNNSSNMIATDEYFSTIENVMRERYSVDDSESDAEEDYNDYDQSEQYQQQARSISPVGGVSRQGATMADQYAMNKGSKSTVRLTPDEFKLARNLQIPDPKREGYFLPSEEAVKRYAQSKAKFAKMPFDPRYTITKNG